MHVDRIPNRSSPPAYLLRETYREGQKVKKRTLANISHWPLAKIEALRRVLRGDFSSGEEQLTLLRSLPHGHVAAALGTLRKLKLDRVLSQGGRQPARKVSLSIAMIVARLLDPASKQQRRGCSMRRRPTVHWARCWASRGSTSSSSMMPSIG